MELNYQRNKILLHIGAQMWACMDCHQAIRKYGNGKPDRESEIMYLTCENCTTETTTPSHTISSKGAMNGQLSLTYSHHPHRFAYVIERKDRDAQSEVAQDVSTTDEPN